MTTTAHTASAGPAAATGATRAAERARRRLIGRIWGPQTPRDLPERPYRSELPRDVVA